MSLEAWGDEGYIHDGPCCCVICSWTGTWEETDATDGVACCPECGSLELEDDYDYDEP